MNVAHLVRSAAASDAPEQSDALEHVFARCQSELLGMLFFLVGNLEDARDAYQQTFLKCWKHRGQLPEIQNVRAWVFRIAMNTGRDVRQTAWRRRRRPMAEHESLPELRAPGPDVEAERRERLELVRRALGGLRPEEQAVFLLRQNGDLTYDEIATTIGIPIGTVKTRMRLALAKLRAALGGGHDHEGPAGKESGGGNHSDGTPHSQPLEP